MSHSVEARCAINTFESFQIDEEGVRYSLPTAWNLPRRHSARTVHIHNRTQLYHTNNTTTRRLFQALTFRLAFCFWNIPTTATTTQGEAILFYRHFRQATALSTTRAALGKRSPNDIAMAFLGGVFCLIRSFCFLQFDVNIDSLA